jgi:acetate kinase
MKKSYVLVLNCGSSSVKFAVIEPHSGDNILSGLVERIGSKKASMSWKYKGNKDTKDLPEIDYRSALQIVINDVLKIDDLFSYIVAVGHRVVHGGEKFTSSALIDGEILDNIRNCCHLAPLHNPANILGIEEARRSFSTLPQVAVFDTAFHQTMPAYAYIYPIPYEFYTENQVRRYGFHGTSHKYISKVAAQRLNIPLEKSAFITAHLGNGCSAAAILNGKSVDTSMGLTPLEGLMMGTRSGDIDPSIISYLVDTIGFDVHRITDILNKKSGFLGVSGVSSDSREIENGMLSGNERCKLAFEIFCYRLAKYISSLMIPLGRLDALLFTGGIGENSAHTRERTLKWLSVFGFELSSENNKNNGKNSNGVITSLSSERIAMVVPTNEELAIAREAIEFL